MATYNIDPIDQKILAFLVKNARMPYLEIARECGVSGAAIHQRIKRLESNGVITGSRLLVKPERLRFRQHLPVGIHQVPRGHQQPEKNTGNC